jgi:hypothetical protein
MHCCQVMLGLLGQFSKKKIRPLEKNWASNHNGNYISDSYLSNWLL